MRDSVRFTVLLFEHFFHQNCCHFYAVLVLAVLESGDIVGDFCLRPDGWLPAPYFRACSLSGGS